MLCAAVLACVPGRAAAGKEPEAKDPPRKTGDAAGAAADVEVRAWPSRTALWVGDRVTYTVELRLGPRVEILADDLSRDKLRPEGLEVVGYEAGRETARDGAAIQTFRFDLAAFELPRPGFSLRVGPLPVRYYVRTPGRGPAETAPSGEVLVPPLLLGFRSTIPDGLESYAARDVRPAPGFSRGAALAGPLGWSLILAAIVPVVVWGAAAARRVRRPRATARRASRTAESVTRAGLAALAQLDPASAPARREGYDRLDALLRSYLADSLGVPAAGLTPPEVETALSGRPPDGRGGALAAVLAECELARYSPPAMLPGPDQFARAVREAERVLARR